MQVRATCRCFVVCCGLAIGSLLGLAGSNPGSEDASTFDAGTAAPQSTPSARAFPSVRLQNGLELTYRGMFSPDALFHPPSKLSVSAVSVPGEDIQPAISAAANPNHLEVPPWMLLSSERIVEEVEPPTHAQAAANLESRASHYRNHAMTFMYGRPSVIHAPRFVVTDSHQRLILSDPLGSAVHVLDSKGLSSFRLVCGAGYRVHKPAGVATDAEDNIYVADSEHGMVVVFDSSGNFLRYVGSHQGEPEYVSPHGLAIDPVRKRLFVVDTPRNQVFELDLNGTPIKTIGKDRRGVGTGTLEMPTDIALNRSHIFILDRWGTRVQVLSTKFELLHSFDLSRAADPRAAQDNGMATDEEGSVYISFFRDAKLRVYTPEGRLLGTFGQFGSRAGQFSSPEGLWVDRHDNLYVADSGNGRVQEFQLKYQH